MGWDGGGRSRIGTESYVVLRTKRKMLDARGIVLFQWRVLGEEPYAAMAFCCRAPLPVGLTPCFVVVYISARCVQSPVASRELRAVQQWSRLQPAGVSTLGRQDPLTTTNTSYCVHNGVDVRDRLLHVWCACGRRAGQADGADSDANEH